MGEIKEKIRNNILAGGLIGLIAVLVIVSASRLSMSIASATDLTTLREAIRMFISSNIIAFTAITGIITVFMFNKNKRKLLMLGLVFLVLTSGIVLASPADPGHTASAISTGTFESGEYTFPQNLIITNNLTVDSGTLFVDATNNRVGIGTTNPQKTLDVVGDINTTADLYLGGNDIRNSTGGQKIEFSGGSLIFHLG